MKVVFLCGGIGKRMFPITEDKFFLKFLGRSLLEHQIMNAVESGIKDFIIIGNKRNSTRIIEITRSIQNIHVDFAIQEESLGIANALQCARHIINDEIIIVNPNDIFEKSAYIDIIEEYSRGLADSYLLGYKVSHYFPGGYMVVNENNVLEKIVEKPGIGKEPSNLVNILVHLHADSKKLFDHFDRVVTNEDCVYELALDNMINNGHKGKVVNYCHFWSAIKYPWNLLTVVDYFLDQCNAKISPAAQISNKAIVDGKVIISEGVKVLENAIIRGPCYIGKNTIIGNNVLIRDGCHIGDNCVIGYSTEIRHSYISDNCWFHSNYIGDSIIGKSCSFGAGTVTANLRFDAENISMMVDNELIDSGYGKFGVIMGNNCKTGVNASIMPGVRMGENSVVGAHVNLTGDLESNKMIIAATNNKVIDKEIFKK